MKMRQRRRGTRRRRKVIEKNEATNWDEERRGVHIKDGKVYLSHVESGRGGSRAD